MEVMKWLQGYMKNGKNNTPLTKKIIVEDNITFPSLNPEQNIILFKEVVP